MSKIVPPPPQQQQQLPPTVSPRTPPFRSSVFSWVPTDEKQLYDCEAAILAPLYKLGFIQYHCAGLNTISLKANGISETEPFDATTLKQAQTKLFHEKFERANSIFPSFSTSSSSGNSNNNKSSSTSCSKFKPPLTVADPEKSLTQHKNNNTIRSVGVDGIQPASGPQEQQDQHQHIIQVTLHHIVFVHGFAGGIANWLPNLQALGKLVNTQNYRAIQKAKNEALFHHHNNNKSNKNKDTKNKDYKPFRAPTDSDSKSDSDDEGNDDDVSVPVHGTSTSTSVELTILHAFDLPGFARSKRDENITFGGPENVLRYMSWSFDEWFRQNEISATNKNVEKWIRLPRQNNDFDFDDEGQQGVPAAKNADTFKFVSAADHQTQHRRHHKITIDAHSYGCYLAAHYCARYPSPFAISRRADDNSQPEQQQQLKDGDSSSSSRSQTASPTNTTTTSAAASLISPTTTTATTTQQHRRTGCGVTHLVLSDPFGVGIFDENDPNHTTEKFNWKWQWTAKFLLGTMESALTPALRTLGPFAPNFINNMRPDFLERWEGLVEDPKMIMDYIFHCNAQKANLGDHSMAKTVIAGSRAFAHLPLLPLVPCLSQIDAGVKVSICYGSNSWMDRKSGEKMFDERRRQLKDFFANAGGASTVGGISCSSVLGLFEIVENAGHQVNTDQPDLYNDFLIRTCELRR